MFPSSASSSLSDSSVSHLIHARKLLLNEAVAPLKNPSDAEIGTSYFNNEVAMILSFLLCVLVCALGLNLIIRCALNCSTRVSYVTEEDNDAAVQLANTGIKKKALKTFPIVTYLAGSNGPGILDTECVICLSEFITGERLRVLPKCHHGFHIGCIDKWFKAHSSCPTCRNCLIKTCQKIVGIRQTSTLEQQSTVTQQTSIVAFEHEAFIRYLHCNL